MYRYFFALLPLVSAVGYASESPVEEAPAAVQAAEVSSPDTATIEELKQEAERYRLADDKAEYLRVLDELHAGYPDDPDVRQMLGNSWLRLGEWDRVELLLADHEWKPVQPSESLRKAGLAARSGGLFQALVLLEEAYRSAPDDPGTLLNLGSIYCQFNRCDKGIVLLRRVTEVNPDDFRGHLAVARAARAERLPELGLAAVQKVEELLGDRISSEPRLQQEVEQLMLDLVEIQSEDAEAEE